jgi:hypothetical protein
VFSGVPGRFWEHREHLAQRTVFQLSQLCAALKHREHREHRQRANPEFVCARVANGRRVSASISPGFSPRSRDNRGRAVKTAIRPPRREYRRDQAVGAALMAASLGQGRRTTISFLKDSWFQAGSKISLRGCRRTRGLSTSAVLPRRSPTSTAGCSRRTAPRWGVSCPACRGVATVSATAATLPTSTTARSSSNEAASRSRF